MGPSCLEAVLHTHWPALPREQGQLHVGHGILMSWLSRRLGKVPPPTPHPSISDAGPCRLLCSFGFTYTGNERIQKKRMTLAQAAWFLTT